MCVCVCVCGWIGRKVPVNIFWEGVNHLVERQRQE